MKKESEFIMSKKKIDKTKLFTRIIAGFMAGLMLLGICFTLIYNIVIMFS